LIAFYSVHLLGLTVILLLEESLSSLACQKMIGLDLDLLYLRLAGAQQFFWAELLQT